MENTEILFPSYAEFKELNEGIYDDKTAFFNKFDKYGFIGQVEEERTGNIRNKYMIREKNIDIKAIKKIILKYNKPARGMAVKPGRDFTKGTIYIENITQGITKKYSSAFNVKEELGMDLEKW